VDSTLGADRKLRWKSKPEATEAIQTMIIVMFAYKSEYILVKVFIDLSGIGKK